MCPCSWHLQTACGTAAVRAGQGSHGHVSQPHRGASTAAPPPRNYTASDADMNNGSITDTNKFYPVAERVDNGRARMPPVEAMHDAPVRPPTMPGYQSRHCNINWGGGGHDERWIVGRQVNLFCGEPGCTFQPRWCSNKFGCMLVLRSGDCKREDAGMSIESHKVSITIVVSCVEWRITICVRTQKAVIHDKTLVR